MAGNPMLVLRDDGESFDLDATLALAREEARRDALTEAIVVAEGRKDHWLREAARMARDEGEGGYLTVSFKRRSIEAETIADFLRTLRDTNDHHS